jgi:uncharacterized protein YcfL
MSVASTLLSACGKSSNFDTIVFNLQAIELGLSVAQTSLTSSSSSTSELDVSSSTSSDIDEATSELLDCFVFYHVY